MIGPAILLVVLGQPSEDFRRGIGLGVAEMAQTAKLLGRELRVAWEEAPGSSAAIVVSPAARAAGEVPAIHAAGLPASAGPCDFALGGNADGTVAWHPTLERYGASELNERFTRTYERPMTSDAWHGWIAVKALVETVLRTADGQAPCATLGTLRFDGHKGRPLRFDPATRLLLHPTYRVVNGRAVEGDR